MNHPKRILVVRLSSMGDVAMTVPVLRALSQQYPRVKITVVTSTAFVPLFEILPDVSVHPADIKKKHKGLWGLYKLSRELKALDIDAVVDLHGVLRSNILSAFLLGKPWYHIDKGRKEKRALISGASFKPLKTTHQRYAETFEALGFKIDLSKPLKIESIPLAKKARALLGERFNKWIGVAPFSAHNGKIYPLDLMKAVIEELSKNYTVILFGSGNHETCILNRFENAFDNVINTCEKLMLNEQLSVISNLDLMVSMDSANGHMAAMLGIKTITIWGVTHPFAGFAPYNQPPDHALLPDRAQFPKIPTSVYGDTYPEGYKEVSRSISPKTVIAKIRALI